MGTSLQNQIRERAYHLWNAGGQVHGQAEQHWLAAEREILAQMTAGTPVSQSVTLPKESVSGGLSQTRSSSQGKRLKRVDVRAA